MVANKYAFLQISRMRFLNECEAFNFFFQAEDGIRDGRVTGVQTCALPISGIGQLPTDRHPRAIFRMENVLPRLRRLGCVWSVHQTRTNFGDFGRRSEERRVGKECRWGWLPDGYKKEKNTKAHSCRTDTQQA